MTAEEAREAHATAQPGDYPAELVEHAVNWLHTCQTKLGPVRKTAPPSRQQAAEFLSIADWGKLHAFLCDLIAHRTPTGGSYGWFIQSAMQAIYKEDLCSHR